MDDIGQWLERHGLGKYAHAFAEAEVLVSDLPHLTDDDLAGLGLPLGPRRRLQQAIGAFSEPYEPTSQDVADVEPHGGEAERRQLTVMFCDLVGSTQLTEEMDPEEYRDLLGGYQSAVSSVVRQYEGYIARYMGDGLLVYFGYPQAHEDDAERAVRAGLSAVSEVRALSGSMGRELAVRIGIATGLVVAGDIVGEGAAEERAVLGETPNLAARLQSIAQPNAVLLSETTQRLVGDRFELESLGPQTLRGISSETNAFRAVSVRGHVSRFEAAHPRGLTELTGRDSELSLLTQRWERACDHEGQLVLLEGEPGIGKSRLIQALQDFVDVGTENRSLQCTPYYSQVAFFPFIQLLESLMGFSTGDEGNVRLAKLERWLSTELPEQHTATPLIASLLSLPIDQYAALGISAQHQRSQTIRCLVDLVEAAADRAPVLLVLEDAHWADPSTLEVLTAIADRIQRLPVLLVVSFRPEFEPPWTTFGHVSALSLNRLGRGEVSRIATSVAAGGVLPGEVLATIIEKTDGVPLFVEELTRTMLEAGPFADSGSATLPGEVESPYAVPSTLHDALLERLDRLSDAKEIAQIAACIGREFGHRILEDVSPVRGEALAEGLTKLIQSQLLVRRGEPPDASYQFRHALVRDAAYGSLLKARRRNIHQRIAGVLEAHQATELSAHPEVLARHFEEAGRSDRALHYWRLAGIRAAERFAHQEAVVNFSHALGLIQSEPDEQHRKLRELQLQNALALSLNVTRGPVEEVQNAYSRARTLGEEIGDPRHLYQSIWGLWHVNTVQMRLGAARDLSYELVQVAERSGDIELRLQAHHSAWTILLYLGELSACQDHALKGRALYDPEIHRHHASMYGGHDPGVCSQYQGAVCEWLLGYSDRAVTTVDDAIALARTIEQPSSEIIALSMCSYIHQFRGDPTAVRDAAGRTRRMAQERGNERYVQTAQLLEGWAQATMGGLNDGIEAMQSSLAALAGMGGNLRRTYYLALLAELCIQARRFNDARSALREAETLMHEYGERWWEAELSRLQAELMIAEESGTADQIAELLEVARQISSQHRALALELRASTTMATFLLAQGERESARECLAPVLERFTEGFATADLVRAESVFVRLP